MGPLLGRLEQADTGLTSFLVVLAIGTPGRVCLCLQLRFPSPPIPLRPYAPKPCLLAC